MHLEAGNDEQADQGPAAVSEQSTPEAAADNGSSLDQQTVRGEAAKQARGPLQDPGGQSDNCNALLKICSQYTAALLVALVKFQAERVCLRQTCCWHGPAHCSSLPFLTPCCLICLPECHVCSASLPMCDIPRMTHQNSAYCMQQLPACWLVRDGRDQAASRCACRAPCLPLRRAASTAGALPKPCRVAGCPQQSWQRNVTGCQRVLWQPGLP